MVRYNERTATLYEPLFAGTRVCCRQQVVAIVESLGGSHMATIRQLQSRSLESTLDLYLRSLEGKNRSHATIVAYRADVGQFIAWLRETNSIIETPDNVERIDITEYLGYLADRGLSGVSRARK